MTSKTIAAKYNVNVRKSTVGPVKHHKWHAFLGGNGTGEPVVMVAKAYGLAELVKRIERFQAGERNPMRLGW